MILRRGERGVRGGALSSGCWGSTRWLSAGGSAGFAADGSSGTGSEKVNVVPSPGVDAA